MIVAPDSPLSETEFVAFDLETTGVGPRSCQIVELGAVRFRLDGTEVGCIEQLVDPGCPIPPAVTRIHGITDAMVRGMPTIAAVLPRLLEFLGSSATLLLAHHAPLISDFSTRRSPGRPWSARRTACSTRYGSSADA